MKFREDHRHFVRARWRVFRGRSSSAAADVDPTLSLVPRIRFEGWEVRTSRGQSLWTRIPRSILLARGFFSHLPGRTYIESLAWERLAMSRAALSPAKRKVRSHTSSRRTASSAFRGSPESPELKPQRPTNENLLRVLSPPTWWSDRTPRADATRVHVHVPPTPAPHPKTPMMRNQLSVPSDSLWRSTLNLVNLRRPRHPRNDASVLVLVLVLASALMSLHYTTKA